MSQLSRGDIVLLNAPDAPKFDGLLATVVQVTDWGAVVTVNAWVPGLTRQAASYRANFAEMTFVGRLPQAVIDAPVAMKPAQRAEATGNACAKCGGLLVRTGTCLTCQSCADSSGGCS